MNINLEKFIIVIPARVGSKSIKNKNIIPINSIPMISYTFKIIQNLKLRKFILSNDSRVIKIAKKFNIDCSYKRPQKVSNDKSSTLSLLKHFHNFAKKLYEYEYIIVLQPTSPVRDKIDVLKSMQRIIKKKYTRLSSISKSLEHPYETVFIKNNSIRSFFPKKKYTRRQDFDKNSYFHFFLFF